MSQAVADPLVRAGCSVGFSSYLGRLATVCTNSFVRVSPCCWFTLWLPLRFCTVDILLLASRSQFAALFWCYSGIQNPLPLEVRTLRSQALCLHRRSHGIINLASNNLGSWLPGPSLALLPPPLLWSNMFGPTPLSVVADFDSSIPLMTQ